MQLREIEPIAHDRHIAYVSHLSHITSFMLGKTVMEKEEDEQNIFDMAGSGFSSLFVWQKAPRNVDADFKQNKQTSSKHLTNTFPIWNTLTPLWQLMLTPC